MRGEPLLPDEWASIGLTELIVIVICIHGRFLELGLAAVDDPARPASEISSEYLKLVTGKSRKLDDQLMEAIERSPRAEELLPEARLNRRAFSAMSSVFTWRALEQNPAAAVMLGANQLPQRPADQPELGFRVDAQYMLERVLRIERLPDYGSPDGPRDLRQEAIAVAVEKFNEIWRRGWDETLVGSAPLEPPPFFAPVFDLRRYNRAKIYQTAYNWLFSGIAPIFFGDPEALPKAARQAYRDQFERRDAKKRGGTGGRRAKAAGTSQERPEIFEYTDDIENWRAADRKRRVSVIDLVTGAQRAHRTPEDEIVPRQAASDLLRQAQKRWGAKGRRFFEALARTTIEEAAKEADVSRATAFNWLKKLQELNNFAG